MLRAVRRATALLAAVAAVPADGAAQFNRQPHSVTPFSGCSVYFCVDLVQTFTRDAGTLIYYLGVSGALTLRQAALDAGFTGIQAWSPYLYFSPVSPVWDYGAWEDGVTVNFPTMSFLGRAAGDQLAFFASGEGRSVMNTATLEVWVSGGMPGGQRIRTSVAPVTTAPEPSTWALLGTGLIAVGGIAARRRKGSATA